MNDSLTIHPPPHAMRQAAHHAVSALKLLGNEDRLLLLCHLSQGECCVSDMEVQLGILQPTLSQQLAVLRRENAVSTRREGKNIFYQVADARLLALLQTLYAQYCPAA
ncbi:MAG: metalloregulator ArsR/SmtB family transcription factor [Comamonas sp.]|jgi:DNA-binding transcriptional ArsR family regulator|uniref:Metalloregulator ArsR/SmtB family transcription factor n=1 Tax=Comamonas koreensis TaxID=160825 RepID=A0AAW4XSW8_9BURK|nr:metalloregulator ArsR/SmtB family transcription factor [Comamonas koreensis]MCD2164205.1 metalloregulator ArsR/SmtB family transcription factor [Comamonas koreensis]MDR2329771.1 metalloregulator ArsR/SmtB family transcription factor [Comamonas sp.]